MRGAPTQAQQPPRETVSQRRVGRSADVTSACLAIGPMTWEGFFPGLSRPGRSECIGRAMSQPVEATPMEEERALVESAQQGNRAALGQLLKRHGQRLYRSVLLPRLGSAAAAEEALGTTFLKAIEHFQEYRWQDCGPYPWLRVIALRVAIDQLRKRRRESLFLPEDLEREAGSSVQAHEDPTQIELRDLAAARQQVVSLMDRLNPRYAEAIRLRLLEGRPRESCAEAMGIKVGTYDVLLHRAVQALKQLLMPQGGAT
jgi:RNA polymerase sigma factor (sigma-70 family)